MADFNRLREKTPATGQNQSAHRSPRILYLSFNDGSDTRINKEVATLVAAGTRVEYVGIGPSRTSCFVEKLGVFRLHFVKGHRKSPVPLARYVLLAGYLLVRHRYHSVHVINEPQLVLLWPFLLLQPHVAADLFDSIFLRHNLGGNKLSWLKSLVYLPATKLIVTDENRFTRCAGKQKPRTLILPNYPLRYTGTRPKQNTGPLTILYFGWLSRQRGTPLFNALLQTGRPLRIIMAGWIADTETRQLTQHPAVSWRGTLPQNEALEIAATQADYIACLYAPVNDNNRHASPNKIYDAIQVEKPVIINAETTVSRFVQLHGTGIVLPEYYAVDADAMYDELVNFKLTYRPCSRLKELFTWEKVSEQLLKAHRL